MKVVRTMGQSPSVHATPIGERIEEMVDPASEEKVRPIRPSPLMKVLRVLDTTPDLAGVRFDLYWDYLIPLRAARDYEPDAA